MELHDRVGDGIVRLAQPVNEQLRRPAETLAERAFLMHTPLNPQHLQAGEHVVDHPHDVTVRAAHVVAEFTAADRAVVKAGLPSVVSELACSRDLAVVAVRDTVAVDAVDEVRNVHLDGPMQLQPVHVRPGEGLGLHGSQLDPAREPLGLDGDRPVGRVERLRLRNALGDELLDDPDAVDLLEIVATLVHLSPRIVSWRKDAPG